MSNIIIIGAGAAGRSAATSAKKTNPKNNVILIGKEPNAFIRCSAPYVLSGENKLKDLIKSWQKLTDLGIELIKEEVIKVDAQKKIVKTKTQQYLYDSLVFATGADPFVPPIPGTKAKNVFTLRTSSDTEKILQASQKAKTAVIIGGGAIGLEIAAAFGKRGIKVKIIEMGSHLLDSVLDEEFSQMIEDELKNNQVEILLNTKVQKIPQADLVIIAAGVKSNTELAEEAGIEIGNFGIRVNEFLETNIKDIYAAGDCASSFCPITNEEVPTRLAPRAVLEGKIAGKNACFACLNTKQLQKFQSMIQHRPERLRFRDAPKIDIPLTLCPFTMAVFDLIVGSVGMIEKRARQYNLKIMIGRAKSLSKHDSFKGAKPIEVKLVFDQDRKIIGGTVVGGEGVAQRLNLISLAIGKKCLIGDLVKLEYTSYPKLTPLPFAEPIVMAAQASCQQVHGKEVW